MKQILFIFQSAPYESARSKDGIDTALVASAFGMEVSVLFSGDAVYQLIAGQNGNLFGSKSIDKLIRSFDLYDINKRFVDASALNARGLQGTAMALEFSAVGKNEIQSLLAQHDIVMSF